MILCVIRETLVVLLAFGKSYSFSDNAYSNNGGKSRDRFVLCIFTILSSGSTFVYDDGLTDVKICSFFICVKNS